MMHVEENIELLNKAEAIEETIQPYFKQIERTAFINQKKCLRHLEIIVSVIFI